MQMCDPKVSDTITETVAISPSFRGLRAVPGVPSKSGRDIGGVYAIGEEFDFTHRFFILADKPYTMITRMPLENFLVIDIETVSGQRNFEALTDDWQHLWQEKVLRSIPEDSTASEYYPQRAGIMA